MGIVELVERFALAFFFGERAFKERNKAPFWLTLTEGISVVLLVVGFLSPFAALTLLFMRALFGKVHDNDRVLPVLYGALAFSIVIHGSGPWSLDALLH